MSRYGPILECIAALRDRQALHNSAVADSVFYGMPLKSASWLKC